VGLVKEALTENGLQVQLYVISDGEKAVEFIDEIDSAQRPCPDLIVLDLNLPKRTGFEVLARVRASTQCGARPVVILSSSGATEDRDETARLGATRYIKKPSDLEEFIAIGGVFKDLLTRKL